MQPRPPLPASLSGVTTERHGKLRRPEGQSGTLRGTATSTAPRRRSKLVPILIGVAAVALLAGGFFVVRTILHPAGTFVEPELKEEEARRISPKENISIQSLTMDEDQYNRYVIEGTIHNAGDQAYDVTIELSAIEHSSDKYGEEVTSSTSGLGLVCVTPYTSASGASVTLYDLEPGDRKITLYTSWDSVEEFLSDVEGRVSKVTLPDAQARTRFDHGFNSDGSITDIQMTYTQDGKLRGSFVNDTGMYLNEVTISYVAKNKDGLPAVKGSGARPYGAVVGSVSVQTLKPGDTGEFEASVGEGYETIEPLDVSITPDPNKSTFN